MFLNINVLNLAIEMAYSTSLMVKQRMKITGSTRDAEIALAVTYADTRCDVAIAANGGSIPVSSPPQSLKEASADFAAYFMHRINNPSVATLFVESAKTMLRNYIVSEFRQGGSGITGKTGVHEV